MDPPRCELTEAARYQRDSEGFGGAGASGVKGRAPAVLSALVALAAAVVTGAPGRTEALVALGGTA